MYKFGFFFLLLNKNKNFSTIHTVTRQLLIFWEYKKTQKTQTENVKVGSKTNSTLHLSRLFLNDLKKKMKKIINWYEWFSDFLSFYCLFCYNDN